MSSTTACAGGEAADTTLDDATTTTEPATTTSTSTTTTTLPPTTTTTLPPATTTTVPPTTTTTQPTTTTTLAPVEGSGDDFFEFSVSGDQPAVLDINYDGRSNFIVTTYDATNERIDGLGNEIGSYRGRVPVNFLAGENVAFIEITASGPWSIETLFLSDLEVNTGSASGTDDDVIAFSTKSGNAFVIRIVGTPKGDLYDTIAYHLNRVIEHRELVDVPNGQVEVYCRKLDEDGDLRWMFTTTQDVELTDSDVRLTLEYELGPTADRLGVPLFGD